MISSIGIFDSLYVGAKLQEKLGDFSSYEVQLFGYLSCLLSLYNGNPISNWGYAFIKNDLGSPYSKILDESLEALLIKGDMEKDEGGFMKLSDTGHVLLNNYSSFPSNRNRITSLEAACKSIQLLPYGVVKDSISKEPIMNYANQHTNKRLLSDQDGPAFSILYDQFEMLKNALGGSRDNLVVPAVVWLEYLAEKKKTSVAL
ncbi:hypothetical protein [Chitinophaga rhizosphaerae]|uniref:hypothetical protein n=1 Tax=Chitinophaga rhizosphaerae TaxID=1864947 RepID=UPI000F810727|nr:hypothetical protein [Chitinophaga rhizosphaerae]